MIVILSDEVLEVGKVYHKNFTLYDQDSIPHRDQACRVMAEATFDEYVESLREYGVELSVGERALSLRPGMQFYKVHID